MIGRHALASFAFVVLADCDEADQHEAATSAPAKDSAVWAQATAQAALLTRVRQAAAKVDGLSEASCPDADIGKALGSGAGKLLTADYDYLARYAEPTHAPRKRGDDPWAFVTTPDLRKVRGPVELESKPAAVDAVYRMRELEKSHPYFAVVRATERRAPAMQAGKFVAGALSGWVVIVDRDAKRLCQASFSTMTPEDIAVPEEADRERALMADFAMRARGALDDAVGRITRVLTLDLG